MELKEIESAIEGVLFAAGEPVGVERLCLALDIDRITADSVCQRLADAYRYERRGIRLVRLDNSYQLCSAPEFADCIRRAFESRRPARLSQPALEVLAIIAYYQPATRAYVDQIRGVDSSYTVSLLLERDLIEECGRLAVPGRPIQYRTTQTFLRSFGLSNLDELPELPNTRRKAGKSSRREKKREERPQPELGGGPLALVKRFLPLIAEAAGRFRRKLRIDVFQLEVTAAAPDPAAAALCFGGANAFIGMIWPLVEQNFNVKERRLRTRVDFDAERPSVYLYAAATLTAGQALALGLRLTTRFLAEFSKYRAEAGSPATSKQKEAV